MTTTHLQELARLLGGESSIRSSAALSGLPECPTVTVEGYGELRLPLTAAMAKKLIAHGEPAPFGKGQETLLDTTVRHTWYFPTATVDVDWHGRLDDVLEDARSALDLPIGCRLEAQFHSLLVYERGQFFARHQDSEKDDAMVATLVVVLPCPFSGGELVVHGPDGPAIYEGSRTATTLVALYADAVHEVLPVRTGHRVALTYNLLMRGDSTARAVGREAVGDAETLLTRHFTTPETSRYGGKPAKPTRLAYLLDHSYTPRTLAQGVGRLKGVDAQRAATLTEAARRAGCDVALALADVHECRDDSADYGGEEYLIDSDVTITHWRTEGGAVEEAGLELTDDEIVATTPSRSLRAYATEHEGYMGNYGNTVDRWYHRGALLVWPTHLAFANRVDAAPAQGLRGALLRLADRDESVTRDLAGLLPTWPDLVSETRYRRPGHGRKATGRFEVSQLFTQALALASFLEDEAIGDALVDPFTIDDLGPEATESLIRLAEARGPAWTRAHIAHWVTREENRGHMALSEAWVEKLPELCRALAGHADLTRLLLEHTWTWLRRQIAPAIATDSTTVVRRRLAVLGRLLAALLAAVAEAQGAADAVRDDLVAWCTQEAGDSLVELLVPALHAADDWPRDQQGASGMRDLAGVTSELLEKRASAPQRAADDWSIELRAGCSCDLCEKLVAFLADPTERVLEWPIAQAKREHVHRRLDSAELPVTHVTRRIGSPYTLVVTKTSDLFDTETHRRTDATRELTWLARRSA